MKQCTWLFFLCCFWSTFGQLNQFSFSVTPTPETCLGNGKLTFSTQNTVSGATIEYTIYLLPNTATPLAFTASSTITGLNAGSYLVVARQSLNGNSGTQQQFATIDAQYNPLEFSVSGQPQICGNDGSITVQVTQGVGATYEIYSGPVLKPLQTSPTFTNLNAGTYGIRIKDICGNVTVTTYTLGQGSASLSLSNSFSYQFLGCDQVKILNSIVPTPNTLIAYPVTVQISVTYTGQTQPSTQTLTLSNQADFSVILPYVTGNVYTIQVAAVDRCGNTFNTNNNVISPSIFASLSKSQLICDQYRLILSTSGIALPYSVNFTTVPLGFNPSSFNPTYPGPFTETASSYGDVGNPVTFGAYTATVTDACNRSITTSVNVQLPPPSNPQFTATSDGCAKLEVTWTFITSAAIISGPITQTFPYDVSNFISQVGILQMQGLPVGTYLFRLTDNCGQFRDLSVVIPPFQPASPSYYMFPGCVVNEGSLKIIIPDKITAVTLLFAPPNYTVSLPQNLDSQCINGDFYFGPVPSGLYTFRFTNGCGQQYTRYITITGLQVTRNDLQINKTCGSFGLLLNHDSNAAGASFWLQKWDSTTNNWCQPITLNPHVANTAINNSTGYPISNNLLVSNLQFSGHFRIVKQYTYNLGNRFLLCAEPIKEIDVELRPIITAVVPFSCNASLTRDVQIQVVGGMAPLVYRIISYNNITTLVQNGQSTLFTNLSAGQYVFEVEDACGEKRVVVYDITLAVSLQVAASDFCPGQSAQLSVPNYSFLLYRWYKTVAPTVTLSTTSQLVFNPFNAAIQGGSYAVQITNVSSLSSCTNTTLTYVVPSDLSTPQAGFDNQAAFCGLPGILNLNTYLSGTYSANGSWLLNTQPLGSSNWNTAGLAFDSYTLVYRVNGFCQQFDEAQITITLKTIPDTPVATVAAPSICVGSSIQLQSSTVPIGTCQWEGPNSFTSTDQNPQINNAQVAQSGTYTVYAEWQGCKSANANVSVNVQSQVVPQAGLGINKELCGAPTQMDLFQQLSGSFTNNGNWFWTDNGQAINNGLWNSSAAGWGVFHFTYTVNGVCAPAAQSAVEVTLKPFPTTPQLHIVPTQVCVGSAVQISVQTQTIDTYIWTGPGNLNLSTQNTFSINQAKLSDAGEFRIQTERNGCFSPMISQTLQVYPNPEAKLDGLCFGAQFKLGAYPLNQSYDPTQVNYTWTGPDQFSGNQQEFLLNGGTPGLYQVKITTANQCFTELKENIESLVCYIPKGISPNNDGKNDTFDLTSFTLIPRVEIFNRFGTMVYKAVEYTDQWHGQDCNDRLLPTGTYYYYIELLSGEKRTGWVYLTY